MLRWNRLFFILLLNILINFQFQAEAKILRGPHEDLESYLEAVDQLRTIVKFFSGNKNLKSSIGVISHAHGLLAKSILKLEEEFRQLLSTYRFSLSVSLYLSLTQAQAYKDFDLTNAF